MLMTMTVMKWKTVDRARKCAEEEERSRCTEDSRDRSSGGSKPTASDRGAE